MLTPLYTQNGIVLEELAPLTYSLESTNHVLDVGVRRFKATEIIHHYLAKYNDGDSFEGKLLSFLMDSPVSVVVCSYESFWRIVESVRYDENGNEFWECQDSAELAASSSKSQA
ncbi:hypothetical protein Bca101_025581 [Brassica carinata]